MPDEPCPLDVEAEVRQALADQVMPSAFDWARFIALVQLIFDLIGKLRGSAVETSAIGDRLRLIRDLFTWFNSAEGQAAVDAIRKILELIGGFLKPAPTT